MYENLLNLLSKDNVKLLTAFVAREANDYGHKSELGKRHWVLQVMQSIDAAVIDKTGVDLVVNTFGNTGVLMRTLILDTKNDKDWRKKVVIDLCPCGKLDHWGSVKEVRSRNVYNLI